ncbi:peptidoglycan DD-metalloendopeptidase family protein [Flavobacterium sp.]|uniref:peptidoglycan DD-metalloendopeptidase family protein n=1 Tax=Flavobacterium sp. TaxID=239 RepID=UPI00261A1644|nr:peptidoglycan DD-metalloendopeptidase family protein [Flavobacterium sp.]
MNKILALFEKINDVKVIDASIDYTDYVAIDLSTTNEGLSLLNLTDANAFEHYIEEYLAKKNAKVAYGGYLENRNLYKRSTVFNSDKSEERNIHIGLDLWIKAGTSVLAALDGTIHSFQNNTSLGDYGPTIILEHQVEEITFYTLYGHLSLDSLSGKQVGAKVTKGDVIATLGSAPINGDYAPHLHFQIIIDLEGKTGDYAGVSSTNTLEFYKSNCPDPNELLKIY